MFRIIMLNTNMYEIIPKRKHKNIVRIIQYNCGYIEVELRNREYVGIMGEYNNNDIFLKKIVKLVNDYCAGRTTLENPMIYMCYKFNQKYIKWHGKVEGEINNDL